MQNMKSAMHAAGIIKEHSKEHSKAGSTKVNKDGSAHLHAGSDAQVIYLLIFFFLVSFTFFFF